jgi:hypothetical protein
MSPTYWVYLVMAATILFNALKAFSRFRLWRIDAAREKLETASSGSPLGLAATRACRKQSGIHLKPDQGFP